MEYEKKWEEEILSQTKYCYFIIDGLDQTTIGIPHFGTSSVEVRFSSMNNKIIDTLEHSKPIWCSFSG